MQYMLIITRDESAPAPAPGEAGFDEGIQAWGAYTRELLHSGALLSGASLQPTDAATTVRLSDGATPVILDGPFAETKEQLAGYYLIEVRDLDAAIEWAKKVPVQGSVEVRPVAMAPDTEGTPQTVS